MNHYTAGQDRYDGIHKNNQNPVRAASHKDVVGWLTTIILCLIILLSGASIGIQVSALQNQGYEATLSLGEVTPPSDTPLFMVKSASEASYLRGAVGIDYDGKDWHLQKSESDGQNLEIQLRGDMPPLYPNARVQTYSSFERNDLKSAIPIDDERYLSMPENISDRVKALSLEITKGFGTAYEKARAIEVYLKLNYTYELDFSPAPSDWEPNDWFLFESKEGICGNFASAFVILARASDIPSRMAAGYFIKSGEGEQMVYQRQAHAWAEVGFEELGWVVFDAT